MEKAITKIVPTPELLSEMEELEILGGDNYTHAYILGKCTVNSGNCVAGCACTES